MAKHKINKKLLLKQKGFFIATRYSSTEETDDVGRWARIIYYNGFCICWINGIIVKKGAYAEAKEKGMPNLFFAHLQFPTSANQGGESKRFDTIDEAIKYAKEMFSDFMKLTRKLF